MEKRIKSRFDGRQIFLPNLNFEEAKTAISKRVIIPSEHLPQDWKTTDIIEGVKRWNSAAELTFKGCEEFLRDILDDNPSFGYILKLFWIAVSRLAITGREKMLLRREDIEVANRFLVDDSENEILSSLSVTDLTLILSMVHLEKRVELKEYNFEMVYFQIEKFIKATEYKAAVRKNVAFKSFENLLSLHVLEPCRKVSKRNRVALPKHFRMVRLQIAPDLIISGIKDGTVSCPTSLKQWISIVTA
uniref:Origin recognition complex subunit 4 C-terminal domain-containing protein n=1 Tax=Aplanochytrium stocchinoi TaxID=215587 RepID=A0A7S3LKE0_9STRA